MKQNLTFSSLCKSPVLLLATGFGTGLAPKAPGTMGTLVAIPLFILLSQTQLAVYSLVVLGLFLVGVWVCHKAEQQMGTHDDGSIVWDEIVGYLIAMYNLPASWLWIISGFVLFRFFDIIKPWPIGAIDAKVSGGFGIMLDDVAAGVAANLVLQVVISVFYIY